MTEEEKVTETEENQAETQELETPADETIQGQDGSEPEQKKETPINQEEVNKRINTLTFKRYEEKRKREELEQKYNELKAKLETPKTGQGEAVDIPAMPEPDLMDYNPEEYKKRIQDRDLAIQKRVEYNLRQEHEQNRIKAEREEQLKIRQQDIEKAVEKVQAKSKEVGISENELAEYDKRVSMFVKNEDLAVYLLNHDESPLILKALAGSVDDLEKISTLPPVQAAAYIERHVAPKASQIKPKVTNTPDPLDIPKGRGAHKEESPFLSGVKME